MTKYSKKLISFALCVCVFFTLLTSFVVVHAQVDTVYEHNFNTDGIGGWGVFPKYLASAKISKFETYDDTYYGDDLYLKFCYVKQSWYSPCLNIYDIIKNSGAGTYHVSMTVAMRGECHYQDSLGTHLLIRGESSNDVNSFIKDRNDGNYFATIGSEHGLWPNTVYGMDGVAWTDVTGTFKVQESDLIRDNGVFNLCLSNLPTDDKVILYVEKVKIIKYDNKQITNGDFTDNFDGWCVWTDRAFSTPMHQGSIKYEGDKSLTLGYEQDKSFFYGSFVRTKTYGSIATSVDPILSFYGPGEYTLSMKIKMERLPNTVQNYLTFFFTKEMGKAHFTIGRQTILENTGWRTIIFNFTLTEEAYKRLDPNNSRVHFRIQSPTENIGEYNGSFESRGKLDDKVTIYDIADVKLTAKTVQGSVNKINIENNHEKYGEGNFPDENETYSSEREYGKIYRGYVFDSSTNTIYADRNTTFSLSATTSEKSKVTWESSNRYLATIDVNNGTVRTASESGITTLTAYIGRSGSKKTIRVKVDSQNIIPTFVGFGQLESGNCWAACAKSTAYSYIRTNNLSITDANRSLMSAISASNEAWKTPNNCHAAQKVFNYYTGSGVSATYVEEYFPYGPKPDSVILKQIIDTQKPITIGVHWPENHGHVLIFLGYFNDINNNTCFLYFDPNKNDKAGDFGLVNYTSFISNGYYESKDDIFDQYYYIRN